MVETLSFAATVEQWVAETVLAAEAVGRTAADNLLRDAQTPVAQGGNMPVDTGNLRNSLAVGVNVEPTAPTPAYVAQLAGFSLGDTISARWTADYAPHVEYGTRGRPGRGFVRHAAARWQDHVAAAEAEVGGGR